MSKTKVIQFTVVSMLMVSALAQAEVKYSNFDQDLARANSKAKTYSSGDAANQVAEFDREQLLRCWQEGELISNDLGWAPDNKADSSASFSSGSKQLLLYQFGETFCIYTGE